MPGALVGSDAARAIHGWSAGAELVWLGGNSDGAEPVPCAITSAALGTLGLSAAAAPVAGCGPQLARLATLAASGDRPLVLVADDLELELPGLLDLLDVPGDRTATVVADPQTVSGSGTESAAVRVSIDGGTLESVRTERHQCLDPNRLSAGILRLAAADRQRAAQLWQQAAAFDWQHSDPFNAALLVLVRGHVDVGAVDLGCYAWSRTGCRGSGAAGSAWQQRLRNASRGGDGPYSTLVLRPLSRRLDSIALKINMSPNMITLISLLIGVGTAALIWTGWPAAWIVAAVTLQLALLVDCMDGEIARFTRRFSGLGAWLDGIGDRVKEYAVFAALGAVAVRDGQHSGWLLALIAMVVVTARHLEDYAYADRTAKARSARPEIGLLTDPGAAPEIDLARTRLPAVPTTSERVRFWLKKIAHVPIAERYLILSLGLLTLRPTWALLAAIAVSAFALIWTSAGRLAKVVIGRDRLWSPSPPRRPTLDDQLDLGILARLAGKTVQLPFLRRPFLSRLSFPLSAAAAVLMWLGSIAAIRLGPSWPAVGLAALAGAVIGAAARRPLHHRLGWMLLPALWVIEAAFWGSLLAHHLIGAAVFTIAAVVAYRRYDLIYSIRLNRSQLGTGLPSAWSVALGFGTEGRILLATLFSLLVADRFIGLALLATAGYLLAVALAESVRVRRQAAAESSAAVARPSTLSLDSAGKVPA